MLPQHSLTKPLLISCDNTFSKMRQLAVLFVTVALSIWSNSDRQNMFPHRKIAQLSVSTQVRLSSGWNNGSHHVLFFMAKPQLAAALFWGWNTERTVCSGNTLLHSAEEAKPQIVRWTVSMFFWPQLSAERRTGKRRDEFWSKLHLTFLSDTTKCQTWRSHKPFCKRLY